MKSFAGKKTKNRFRGNTYKPKEDHHSTKCKTKKGINCQFPFTYKGKLYFDCPPDPVEEGEFWCSTKTDQNGNHITGKGYFGLCDSNCPRHKEKSYSGTIFFYN